MHRFIGVITLLLVTAAAAVAAERSTRRRVAYENNYTLADEAVRKRGLGTRGRPRVTPEADRLISALTSKQRGGAPVGYMVEQLILLGPSAAGDLARIASKHDGAWWADRAREGLLIVSSPRRLALYRRDHRSEQKRGNPYVYADRAAGELAGGRPARAAAMFRSLARHEWGAPRDYAIEHLQRSGKPLAKKLLEVMETTEPRQWP